MTFTKGCCSLRAISPGQQFLHTSGPVGRAVSYQLLSSGLSIGANAAEGDGASSPDDFVAKFRISLKEAKETHFRLQVCRRCDLLDAGFDPVLAECEELTRILAAIVHSASRRKAANRGSNGRKRRSQNTVNRTGV